MTGTVRDWMTRNPTTVGPDDSVETVRQLVEQNTFHHLLVVEHARLIGVISDRDRLRNLSPFIGRAMAERQQDVAPLRRVHQIMTRSPVAAPPDLPVGQTAALLLERGVSCLPIVTGAQRPLGILKWKDPLRAMLDTTVAS